MSSKPQPSPRPAPRLYLVTNEIEDAAAFAPELAAVLGVADIAAVLLRLKTVDERTLINRVKTLASVVQNAGAALLLDSLPDIVARGGADGAHLPDIDAFLAALDALKPDRIAGLGGLETRHDAMVAAERDTDYVMFGEPNGDRRPSFEAILERVGWWAEVFETPCVAYAAQFDEITPLVAAGADFIALGDAVWNDPRGAAMALQDAARRLVPPQAVA